MTLKNKHETMNLGTLQEDCISKGTRVLIPQTLRSRVKEELHEGHTGILKMKLLRLLEKSGYRK